MQRVANPWSGLKARACSIHALAAVGPAAWSWQAVLKTVVRREA